MTEPEGREFLPCFPEAGEAQPGRAESWLRDWSEIGGGVSIGLQGELNAYRFIYPLGPQRLQADDFAEGALLYDLENTLGLAASVRVVISTRAGQLMRQGLKGMGIEA